ncbi:hypothetical protein DFH11DRAFT_124112 [Phellopilus nigrolimitatus]|nr:hypothetical protein DFH11DRAFT_124112 [Phellopilus nigrolimitatus]
MHTHQCLSRCLPRGRRECRSSAELACFRRREGVEPRISRSSDARCPRITCSSCCPAFTGSDRPTPCATHHHHYRHHHYGAEESGPFREEDVLLSLQLFAYHSKYSHVRQASYKPRLSFRPATAIGSAGTPSTSAATAGARDSSSRRGGARTRTGAMANAHSAVTVSADLKKNGYRRSSSPSRRTRSLPRVRRMAPPMLPQLLFDSASLSPSQHVRAHPASPPYGPILFVLLRSCFCFCLAGCQAALRVGSSSAGLISKLYHARGARFKSWGIYKFALCGVFSPSLTL